MRNEVIQSSDIIVQLGLTSENKIKLLKENQILVGVLNPYQNKEKLDALVKKKSKFFFRIVTKNYKSTIYGYFIITS